ncbi:MAG: hypothetical protein ABIH38_00810 [Patescibacteria group bacterium]
MTNKNLKFGLLAGALEVIYIVLVALFMQGAENWFSGSGVQPVIMVLMLFVLSAAVSGLLVLGYPAYLALQKKYKEAICTLLVSLAVIFILFVIGLIFYLVFRL